MYLSTHTHPASLILTDVSVSSPPLPGRDVNDRQSEREADALQRSWRANEYLMEDFTHLSASYRI